MCFSVRNYSSISDRKRRVSKCPTVCLLVDSRAPIAIRLGIAGGDHSHPLLTMDIIQHCLSLAPLPYLSPAFSALRFIWSSVQQAQASKRQLEALTQLIAQLLKTLDSEYRARRLLQASTSRPLDGLRRFVVLIFLRTLNAHCNP
jgi:hypothetical protein